MIEHIQPNLVTTDILFKDEIGISPRDMLNQQPPVRLPIEGDYVPLYIFDRKFAKASPVLEAVGDAAVRLSLGKDFGFLTNSSAGPNRTPLVPDLVFSHNKDLPVWTVTVQTPAELSLAEQDVIGGAALQYAVITQKVLRGL